MKDPFELPSDTKPRKAKRVLSEGDIQSACVNYARSKGYWARKFSSPSQRSVPDYLFGKRFPACDVKWAEEFKSPGKHSTKAQTKEQDLMVVAGWTVVRDTGTNGQADIEAFKRRIDSMEKTYDEPNVPFG